MDFRLMVIISFSILLNPMSIGAFSPGYLILSDSHKAILTDNNFEPYKEFDLSKQLGSENMLLGFGYRKQLDTLFIVYSNIPYSKSCAQSLPNMHTEQNLSVYILNSSEEYKLKTPESSEGIIEGFYYDAIIRDAVYLYDKHHVYYYSYPATNLELLINLNVSEDIHECSLNGETLLVYYHDLKTAKSYVRLFYLPTKAEHTYNVSNDLTDLTIFGNRLWFYRRRGETTGLYNLDLIDRTESLVADIYYRFPGRAVVNGIGYGIPVYNASKQYYTIINIYGDLNYILNGAILMFLSNKDVLAEKWYDGNLEYIIYNIEDLRQTRQYVVNGKDIGAMIYVLDVEGKILSP